MDGKNAHWAGECIMLSTIQTARCRDKILIVECIDIIYESII